MLRVVTVEDAKKDDTFEKVGAFRYKCFYDIRNWRSGLNVYKTKILGNDGKPALAEKDEFDTNEMIYVISYNNDEIVNGITRFQSTQHPYMLQKDCFKNYPDFINKKLPVSPNIWEATRTGFGISNQTSNEELDRIKKELITAFFEIGLKNNVKEILGTMSKAVIYMLFGKAGCTGCDGRESKPGDDVSYLGNYVNMKDSLSGSIDKSTIAARLQISETAYKRIMQTSGTSENLLYTISGNKTFPGIQVLPKIPYTKEDVIKLQNLYTH